MQYTLCKHMYMWGMIGPPVYILLFVRSAPTYEPTYTGTYVHIWCYLRDIYSHIWNVFAKIQRGGTFNGCKFLVECMLLIVSWTLRGTIKKKSLYLASLYACTHLAPKEKLQPYSMLKWRRSIFYYLSILAHRIFQQVPKGGPVQKNYINLDSKLLGGGYCLQFMVKQLEF